MKLSRRTEYALLALIDLAGRPAQCPVRLQEIAEDNQIPRKFLEQILTRLRHSGVVVSRVGTHGGYSLARPADEITIGEIIRMLEGTLVPAGCEAERGEASCSCPDPPLCPVRAITAEVREAVVSVVDSQTLADRAALRRINRRRPARQSTRKH